MEEKFNINKYIDLKNKHISEKIQGDVESIRKSLEAIRDYLDKCGYAMPEPFYKYDPDKKETWKYLESLTGRLSNGDFRVKEVLNPEFIYGHLV
jgi:hypothetical protein